VDKQHQDMRHEPVMDVSMMMESADIMTLMATRMEILPENVDLHGLFVLIYFPNRSKSWTILLCSFPSLPLLQQFKQTIHYVSPSHFSFQSHNLPFDWQTLPTSYSRQTPYLVSSRCGPIYLLQPHPLWSPLVSFWPVTIVPGNHLIRKNEWNRHQPLPSYSIRHPHKRGFQQPSSCFIFWNQTSGTSHSIRLAQHQTSFHRLAFSSNYHHYRSNTHYILKETYSSTFSKYSELSASLSDIWWTRTIVEEDPWTYHHSQRI
jgi:hypothetical protein